MLINLRNALMTRRRLPYDAEIEYLQSSGTQYIDTLVNADSNLSVEITMANAGTPWNNVNPMGVILATPRRRHHLNFQSASSAGVCYFFGNLDNCQVASGYKPPDGEIFTFKVDAISKTFTLGSFRGTFPNDTFDTGLSYWLFGRNGTTPPYLGSLRICSAKLWNGSTLVRDYIPVRVGTTGELYDRVSGKFAERHGDFVLGQDVVPVEYIESHGTEWIDTGVVPTIDDSFYCRVKQNVVVDQCLWGLAGVAYCFSNAKAGGTNVYGTYWGHPAIGMGGVAGVNPLGDTNWHEILCQPSGIFVDGTQINTQGTAPTQSPLNTVALFARAVNSAGGGVAKNGQGRMSAFRIERNGDPLRKYYPVRVGTEGAMMDTLTRRIYRNAGTGAFSYGNDLKYPIPA